MKTEDRYFRENPSVLAFVGDAVYEVYIRKYVLEKGVSGPDRMNSDAIRYVRAEAQAAAYDTMLPELTEKEASVARRGKNHKITSMPGNLDYMTYKKATAFEALVGYLDLSGQAERCTEIMKRAVEIIDKTTIQSYRHRKNGRGGTKK